MSITTSKKLLYLWENIEKKKAHLRRIFKSVLKLVRGEGTTKNKIKMLCKYEKKESSSKRKDERINI